MIKHSQKIEELRKYFQTEYPDLSIQTKWDINFIAQSFRFDRSANVAHLLMISNVVLEDYSTEEIIEKLKTHSWKHVLAAHGSEPIMFTSYGFQIPEKR